MFTEIDISLTRERNERLHREVRADRLEKRLRTNGERGSGLRRAVGSLMTGRRAFEKEAAPENT